MLNLETLTDRFNDIMTETAKNILWKTRRKTQLWVRDEILQMCDRKRDLISIRKPGEEQEEKNVLKSDVTNPKQPRVNIIPVRNGNRLTEEDG